MEQQNRLIIRLAKVGEYSKLFEVRRDAYERFGPNYVPYPFEEDDFHKSQKTRSIIVGHFPDGDVLGYSIACPVFSDIYVWHLNVRSTARGQKVGAQLLDRVCSYARFHKKRAVTLLTGRRPPWNMPYYEKQGFHAVNKRVDMEPYMFDILKQAVARRRRINSTNEFDGPMVVMENTLE